MSIFDATLVTLQRALDVRLARHELLAGNLANAETPGFVPRDIDFAAAMREGTREPASVPVPRDAMTFASAGHQVESSVTAAAPPDRGTDIPLAMADHGSVAAAGFSVIAGATAGAGLDGNAVDVDRALAAVAENAIQYGAVARAAQKKLAILRYAASDGAA